MYTISRFAIRHILCTHLSVESRSMKFKEEITCTCEP